MCLAVPGKIISIDDSIPEMKMARVAFGGIVKTICIQWIDAREGDYILAHAGMAISAIDTEEAEITLRTFEEIANSIDSENLPG